MATSLSTSKHMGNRRAHQVKGVDDVEGGKEVRIVTADANTLRATPAPMRVNAADGRTHHSGKESQGQGLRKGEGRCGKGSEDYGCFKIGGGCDLKVN